MREQGLGRSKGGLSRKWHGSCDGLGNPARFFVTAGQRSDISKALIESRKMDPLIADKSYDADYNMVKAAKDMRAKAVIPSRARRKEPRARTRNCIKGET